MTNKNVTKATKSDLTTASDLAAWGTAPTLSTKDILIPKVLAMQGQSDMVTEGKAKFGDFRNSVTGELLGDLNNSFEFIPFKMEKVWVESVKKGNKFEFVRVVPITTENENLDISFVVDKKEWRRDYTMNFYVMLTKEIKTPGALPKIISFKRTSARAGKQLATMMYVTNQNAGLSPAGKVVSLSGSKESNDLGTFVVMHVTETRESTNEEVTTVLKWFKSMQGTTVYKTDDSDLGAPSEATTKTPHEYKEGQF